VRVDLRNAQRSAERHRKVIRCVGRLRRILPIERKRLGIEHGVARRQRDVAVVSWTIPAPIAEARHHSAGSTTAAAAAAVLSPASPAAPPGTSAAPTPPAAEATASPRSESAPISTTSPATRYAWIVEARSAHAIAESVLHAGRAERIESQTIAAESAARS